MTTVLTLGGGITGLTATYHLQKQLSNNGEPVNLILAEANSHLGGKIRTKKEAGFVMETGADSIVSRKITTSPLFDELSLADQMVYNSVGTSYLFGDGTLKQIPKDTVFGIPTSIESLANSPLISAEGKVAALKDLYSNEKEFTKTDSIGAFLEYYLGEELVKKQIAPVLSGVYSGELSDLTISSTLPYLLDYKKKYGSIIKGLEVNQKQFLANDNKKFLSFEKGLGTLVDTIGDRLTNVDVKLGYKAERIEKKGQLYQVYFSNGEIIEADYLILSIPHTEAQKLLNDVELNVYYSTMKTSTLYSVYIGYDVADDILPADGTGFITYNNKELYCNACTWTSRKWKHTSQNGNLLVRLFYKSSHPRFPELRGLSEKELLKISLSDIEKSLKIRDVPVVSEVTKWTDQMPTYQITHPETVQNLEAILTTKYQGLFLAGCSYYGVGIPDCIENGYKVADSISQKIIG